MEIQLHTIWITYESKGISLTIKTAGGPMATGQEEYLECILRTR